MLQQKFSPNKVIFLTQYFYPELNSTAQLLYELAIDLIDKGLKITIYAKYPDKWPDKISRTFQKNLTVHWIKTTSFPKRLFWGRSINYAIFFIRLVMKTCFSSKKGKILVLSSPPFLPILAFLLNRIKRQRYIYLVHDLYPDVAVKLGFLKNNGLIEKLWVRFNRLLIKHADKVIVLDKSMQNKIEQYTALCDKNKLVIIPNWADGDFVKPISKDENPLIKKLGLENKFIIMYAGNFGLTHNLEIFLQVAKCFMNTNVVFLFIGEGAKKKKMIEMMKQENISNVRILPYFDRELLPFSLAIADIHLIVLDKGFNGLSVPSKIYNILASGRPILAALEKGGEIEKIINLAQCGRLVAPDNLKEIEFAISCMLRDPDKNTQMGLRAREYFEKYYDRKKITNQYFQLLSD